MARKPKDKYTTRSKRLKAFLKNNTISFQVMGPSIWKLGWDELDVQSYCTAERGILLRMQYIKPL